MRARDKPSFPAAEADGLYGCGRCGAYHRIRAGGKLSCSHCRSAVPLILVDRQGGALTDGRPIRLAPSPAKDRW